MARAAREKRAALDVGDAVVTPSARDEAGRLGIELLASRANSAEVKTAEGAKRDKTAAGAAGAEQRRGRSASARPDRHADSSAPSAPSAPSAVARDDAPPARRLTIAVGADHGGVAMKDAIAARLRELGHDVSDVGTSGSTPVDYPDFAAAVARRVADAKADFGIMVDGAGIGSCMAANKIPGVRAAMCYDVTTAQNAREHNDARVLTLGGGLIGTRLALAIVETFLATPFAGGRHAPRVAKIDDLDRRARS